MHTLQPACGRVRFSGARCSHTPQGQKKEVVARVADATVDRRGVLLASTLLLSLSQQYVLPVQASEIKKVFVAGATGATGQRVVSRLLAAGYQVRAGCRDPSKAAKAQLPVSDPGMEVVAADVTGGVAPLVAAIGDAEAVICCTGVTKFGWDESTRVDELGTRNLVDAAKAAGVGKFVLMTSLLTNGAAKGQSDNFNYRVINAFGSMLDHKLKGELYLRSSGLDYTIVRPGGLSSEPPEDLGRLVVGHEDTLFALDSDPGRDISRDTVAEVLVEALRQPASSNKVVEVVASPSAPELPRDAWFL